MKARKYENKAKKKTKSSNQVKITKTLDNKFNVKEVEKGELYLDNTVLNKTNNTKYQ